MKGILIFLVLIILCYFGIRWINKEDNRRTAEYEKNRVLRVENDKEIVNPFYIADSWRRTEYQGHIYIVAGAGNAIAMAHDPDCHCYKKVPTIPLEK